MSDPLLSARNLSKTYTMGKRTLEVLRGVSLDVASGDFLALRGASGAGKSTLLHLLGGLDSPNTGEIWFNGGNIARLSATAQTRLRNQKIVFVFQAYHLLPELDALENVCLPARIARTPAAQAECRGRELLARVGLKDRTDHKPYELSGGEQRRVAIARAMINEPELILADEPTGNLDSHTGEGIIDLLTSLRAERNATLLIATKRVNMTLIFSASQALLAAKAGARHVSPFVGRLDDISAPGMELVADIIQIFDHYHYDCEVLAASLRHPMHVIEAGKMGADIATMPTSVFNTLLKHPLTDIGLKRFVEDWEKVKAQVAAKRG